VNTMSDPILITGMGALSGAGPDNDAFAAALREGGGAFSDFPAPLDLLPPGFGGVATADKSLIRKLPGARPLRPSTMTRYTYLSTVGLGLCLADAGVEEAPVEAEELRRGLYVGSYVNLPEMHKQVGMSYQVRDREAAAEGRYQIDDAKIVQGMKRFTGFEFLRLMNNMPVAHGAIQARAKGPCNTFMGFASAGLQAVGAGMRALQDGHVDTAFCGGAGTAVLEHGLMYKAHRGLLATDKVGTLLAGDDPGTTCQPFGEGACGIVPGEGAGFVTLETEIHAEARGACPVAALTGYATGFAPPTEQRGYPADHIAIAGTVRAALDGAGLQPADIDLLVPTGYGLPRMDAIEFAAYADVFGDAMPQVLPFTPVTGFCEAAHGSLGLCAALVALTADGGVTPWRPAAPIGGYPAAAQPPGLRRALVVAAAMEGNTAAVVVERFSS